MSKILGGLPLRRLASLTRPRFSSYLSRFQCHSQAESSLVNYIKRLQNDFSARHLSSPTYPQYIQKYKEDLAAEASAECRGNSHVLATPILDVLYVSVDTNDSHGCVRKERPFLEIYGNIQLIDEQNFTYDVYHRELDNPETVSPGGNLSLTRLNGTCRSLFLSCVSALKMRVHLRDAAAEGKDIAKGDFDIQLMDKTCHNGKIVTKVVDGHGAFASIQYATLPYAVIAKVKLYLTKNNETESDQSHALIYGTISASSKLKDGSISSVLFNRAPTEPIMVDLAVPIKLSRDVLAVPAYSCIQIKTDLWDHHTNQQIASDVIVGIFDAKDGGCKMQKLHLGQNYHIKVTVEWSHAYMFIFDKFGHEFKGQKLLCGQIRSLTSNRFARDFDFDLPESYPCLYHFESILVEVFSISISSLHDDMTSHICGTIKLYLQDYGEKLYCLFEKNNSNPEMLDGDMKIKSLKWPSGPFRSGGDFFGMHLHLIDDAGLEVCKGYLDWNIHFASYPLKWYGTRLSSVIRGQHGYATVHYAFFNRAIKAKVKVVFIPNKSSDVPFKISGDIVARYSTFIYSSYSEKTFFQSTLFGDNHDIIVAGGSPLVLQKSVVPVPYGSSLTVDVKLHAQAMHESSQGIRLQHFGSLDKVVDFDVDVDETCIKRIKGEDFAVDLFVEWG